ncbi:MAG: Gfo/Idh/MocA family protein [Actinomycetota bacterium]
MSGQAHARGGLGAEAAARPGSETRAVALIGYGVAGEVFHAPLIAATPGLRLASVVTGDPARRARLAAAHPHAVALDDVDALWDRAEQHDLVVVASPTDRHVAHGLAAIERGLAVVIDKPVASDAEGARRLAAAAAEAGVVASAFHNRRYDGDFLTLQGLLADGALGEVWRYESRFERWRPAPRPGAWREQQPAARGGGLLLDLGSHLVDQALVLFGPPSTVYAEVLVRRAGVHGDDDAFVALGWPAGLRAHLWMSAVAAQPGPRLRVLGSAAGYTTPDLDGQEDALRAGASPLDEGFGQTPPERWGRFGTEGQLGTVPTARGAYPRFYTAVVAALAGAGPVPVPLADAVAALEVLDAARRSAGTGQVVGLGA